MNILKADKDNKILRILLNILKDCSGLIAEILVDYNDLMLKEIMINSTENYHRHKIKMTMESEKFDFHAKLVAQILKFFEKLSESNPEGKALCRKTIFASISGQADSGPNMISSSIEFLDILVKNLCSKAKPIVDSILNFLLTSINGPEQQNQMEMWNGKIVDPLRELTSQDIEEKAFLLKKFNYNRHSLTEVITKIIKMYKLLLEGNQDYVYVSDKIRAVINVDSIIKLIEDDMYFYLEKYAIIYEDEVSLARLNKLCRANANFDPQLKNIFDIYFFLMLVYKDKAALSAKILTFRNKTRNILAFFHENSGHIEVVYNKEIHIVWTIRDPIYDLVDQKIEDMVVFGVRRESPKHKLLDFVEMTPKVFDLITYQTQLTKNFINLSHSLYDYVNYGCLIITTCLNLMILFGFEKEISHGKATTSTTFDENHILIKLTGGVH